MLIPQATLRGRTGRWGLHLLCSVHGRRVVFTCGPAVCVTTTGGLPPSP